ncbi:MAG: helix-turn-helix transcriptional regulator [Rhizomicrobium sp.]|nr:helix-turn-helix transcriptional regulator [Rhizomicrobium sp.]
MNQEQKNLTPKQVRAGRALLAWSQQDLAKKAGVAASTVADFERGQRTPVPNNADAMRAALEQAGINFPAGGAVSGPPIPGLGSKTGRGTPVRIVTAGHLAQWAELKDGPGSIPALISRLARADGPVKLHFPSDEAIGTPGWDGITESAEGSEYIPPGVAAWEIGTQRQNITTKANDDYNKRSKNPGHLRPLQTTFIFVTPRGWATKEKWAAEKRAQGIWKDVRAYDGTDLLHWLELYPAVGDWLAKHLGLQPNGTYQLKDIWEEWSLATQPALPADLVLSDRDKEAANLLNWLREPSSTFALQGATTEEVAAFAYAAITQLPPEIAEHYLARMLVTASADAARTLANSQTRLVLVLLDPEAGLAETIAKKGHHVLMAYGLGSDHAGRVRQLERPSRVGIEATLVADGLDKEKSKRYAREAYRSLAILRRLLPSRASRIPSWACPTPPKALLAALMAGGWDEQSDADKAVVSAFANMDYDDLVHAIAPYIGHLDSPLRKVGSTWKVASPQDAWLLLAPYLTTPDIDRFQKTVLDVLGAADPRYEMDAAERWYAPIRGIKPKYSGHLRHGLSEILIMLALFGDRVSAVSHAEGRAEGIVRTLLHGADAQRWWSLSDDFQLLAEASPSAFLEAVEDSLLQDEPTIKVLYGRDPNPLFGGDHIAPLLWALGALGWCPELLSMVASTLARLIAAAPADHKGNHPSDTLRELFIFWNPQTYATLQQRFRVIDRLRKEQPVQAWRLMLGILPGHHDSFMVQSSTRWRDFTPDEPETVTYGLINEGGLSIIERLLKDVGTSAGKWVTLLNRLRDFPDRLVIIAQLQEAVDQINDISDRLLLWRDIRQLLHHNREFADSDWALPESELANLEEIYNLLTPQDPVLQFSWLFDHGAGLPNPAGDWDENGRQLETIQRETAPQLLAQYGADLIFAIADRIDGARTLGFELGMGGISKNDRDEILERALKSTNTKHQALADGLIRANVYRGNDEIDRSFIERLAAKALQEGWGDAALQTILFTIPSDPWAWKLAERSGPQVEKSYWRHLEPFGLPKAGDEAIEGVKRLAAAGRAHAAVGFTGHLMRNNPLPSALLIQILKDAAQTPLDEDASGNAITMFQYHVAEILSVLDRADDVSRDDLIGLEWLYLPILEYSRRPPKVIMQELARNPGLFVEMISAVFRPSEESGIKDEPPVNLERAQRLATQAYRLLNLWAVVPGTQEDGGIDPAQLDAWVRTARKLATEKGRLDITDQKIGEILSAAQEGDDGIWPSLPVRELIDHGVRSRHIDTGFELGKRNRRGVTTRLPRDGGSLERGEAAYFRKMSRLTNVEWPHLSGILDRLAKSYEHDAGWHDDDVERLDW